MARTEKTHRISKKTRCTSRGAHKKIDPAVAALDPAVAALVALAMSDSLTPAKVDAWEREQADRNALAVMLRMKPIPRDEADPWLYDDNE